MVLVGWDVNGLPTLRCGSDKVIWLRGALNGREAWLRGHAGNGTEGAAMTEGRKPITFSTEGLTFIEDMGDGYKAPWDWSSLTH